AYPCAAPSGSAGISGTATSLTAKATATATTTATATATAPCGISGPRTNASRSTGPVTPAAISRDSICRLLEGGLAIDADRLPALLSAPVEGIALACALLRGAHGHRIPGLQRFLRRHAAVAVPVHVLRFDARGECQAGVPRVARVQDQQREHAEQQLAPQRDSGWPAQWLHAQSTRLIFAPSPDSLRSMFS